MENVDSGAAGDVDRRLRQLPTVHHLLSLKQIHAQSFKIKFQQTLLFV